MQALHSRVDPANPLSKQAQATIFEPEAPLVLHALPIPIPEPEPEPVSRLAGKRNEHAAFPKPLPLQIVIGYRRNDHPGPAPPAKAESRSIVIGYSDGDRQVTR